MEGLLTTREYCEKEKIDRTTLWRWVASGKVIQYKDPKTGYSYYRDLEERFLTIKEVCFRLGITDRTLRNYVRAGRITPDVIFKNMFSEKEVSRFEQDRIKSLKLVEPFSNNKRGK